MASRVLRQRGTGVSVRVGRRTQAEKDKDSKKREKKSRSSSKKETLAQEVARKTGKTVTSVRGGVGRGDTKEVVRTTARGQERTVGRITSQDGRRTLVRERGGDPRTLRTAVKLETQLQAREKPTEFKQRTEETARVARVRQERLSRGAPIRAKDIIPRGQAVPLTRENITAVRQIAAEQARRTKETPSQREIIEQIRERGIVKRVDPFARVSRDRPTIPLQKTSPQESFLPEQTIKPEITAPQIERPQSTLERLESPQEVAAKQIRPFTGRKLSTKLATAAIFLGVKGEELVSKISRTAETKEGTVVGILAGSSTVAIGAGKAFIETGELIGAVATKTGRQRIATGLGEFMKSPIVNIQRAGLEFGAELRRRPGEQIGRFGADIVSDIGVAKAGKAGLSLVGRVADVIDPRFAKVVKTAFGSETVKVAGAVAEESFVDRVADNIVTDAMTQLDIDALRGTPQATQRQINIELVQPRGTYLDVDPAAASRKYGADIPLAENPTIPKLKNYKQRQILEIVKREKAVITGSFAQETLGDPSIRRGFDDIDILTPDQEKLAREITQEIAGTRIKRTPKSIKILTKEGKEIADIVDIKIGEGGFVNKFPTTEVSGIQFADLKSRLAGKTQALGSSGKAASKAVRDIPVLIGEKPLSSQQLSRGYGLTLGEQASFGGKTGDVATAQRDLFTLLRSDITIDKPLPSPTSSPLEKSFFASPFDPDTGRPQLRTSRLMLDADAKNPDVLDLLTADIKTGREKPQIIVFEKQRIQELPSNLKASIGAGKQLTPSQQKQLLEFQLEPSGKFKPVGFLTSEAELTLAPGETVKKTKKLGTTRIKGQRVDIVGAEIVQESSTLKQARQQYKIGKLSEEQYRKQLAKQTGLDFSRSVERRAVVEPVEIGAFIGTRVTREASKLRSTDVGIGLSQPQARRLIPDQIQTDIITRPRPRDPIRITSIPIRARSTARDIEIVRQPKRVARRPARTTEPIFRPEPRRIDPRPVRPFVPARPSRRPIETPYRPDRTFRPDITPPPDIFTIPKVRVRPKTLKVSKIKKKKKRKEKGFSPTFFAAFGNIRGFEKEGVAQTGLSIRPIGKPAKFSIKF